MSNPRAEAMEECILSVTCPRCMAAPGMPCDWVNPKTGKLKKGWTHVIRQIEGTREFHRQYGVKL